MAAERDQAGAAGPGLSGGGFGGERDEAGLRAGTTGSSAMGDRPGVGEVHTGLHSGSASGEYGGIAFASETSSTGRGGLRGAGEAVRGAAGTVKERAGQAASQARDRLGQVSERAHTLLEERGLLERVGDNPLPVLGVAFAAGFLLASVGQNRETKATRARNDLRNALMAGVSAGLAQGAKGFLSQAGRPEGFVNTFLSSLAGGGGRGGSGGGSYGGSGGTGGGSYRGGATAGAGSTGTTHRPPSHRENL